MTTQLRPTDRDGLSEDWARIEAGPSIEEHRHRNPELSVAPFAADMWPLKPMGAIRQATLVWVPTSRRTTTGADGVLRQQCAFPAILLPSFKRAAWLLVNRPTPEFLRTAPKTSSPSRQAPGSIGATVQGWRRFAVWLEEQNIRRLDDVTTDVLDQYALDVRDSGLKALSRWNLLHKLIHLWALAPWLPECDRIAAPAFMRNGQVEARHGYRDEASTRIIQSATMGPMLSWALLCVEELSQDMLAAAGARAQMVKQAMSVGTATNRGRQRAIEVVESVFPSGTALPAFSDRGARSEKLASTYLAARYGEGLCNGSDFTWAVAQVHGPSWRRRLDSAVPQPLDVPVLGRIDGQPWTPHLDWREGADLLHQLEAACLILTAYLTGMRPQEVLSLRGGCLESVASETGSLRHIVHGRRRKGVRDEEGEQSVEGEAATWITIKPVADALAILDARSEHGAPLFRSSRDEGVSMTTSGATFRIAAFVDWANHLQTALALPESLAIPPCPGGAITLRRFRRTLAWHIRHQPQGHVALAVQYQHLTPDEGEGYAGAKRHGLTDLLDDETRAVAMETTTALRDEIAAGGGVSGLGADRAIQLASRFVGSYLTQREERILMRGKDLVVFDNPLAFALCLNDPDKAMCLTSGQNNSVPNPMKCGGSRCSNIVFTDATMDRQKEAAARLRQEASHAPAPLAQRLSNHADTLEAGVALHVSSRKTASAKE
jgi:integrase